MMREIELLQRQFQDAANQFPGLMHVWILYSKPCLPPDAPTTLKDRIIVSYWGPDEWTIKYHKCLWEYWFVRRKHHRWDADDAVRMFEWLAEKAHLQAYLLRELLPEMQQIEMTRFSGGTPIVKYRELWLLDVYRLNLVSPLSKGDGHFYWFSRPEKDLVNTISNQLSTSEADIFYLDDVFLESAFACSNLLELLSVKETTQKPKAKEQPKLTGTESYIMDKSSAQKTKIGSEKLTKDNGVKVPILKLIEQGENASLEFKETLEFDTQQKGKNKDILLSSLKTIAALLNSKTDGTLLIGVDDSGKIRGIERDLSLMKSGNKDKFELKIRNCLKDRFKPQPISKVNISFEKFTEGTICRVDVQKSKEIVHLDNEVYVRDGNTTQKLEGRALTDWIQQRKN